MRERHPALARLALAQVLFTIAVIFGAALGNAASEAALGYRLTGTMAVKTDFLAFLEVPGGGQILVRSGDVVGKARVTGIRDRECDLVISGKPVTLTLEGSSAPVIKPPTRDVVVSESADEHVLGREVAVEPFRQAVSGPGQKSSSAQATLAQRIAPVLDLPPQSRVVAVNGENVTSAERAIDDINKVLASGGTVTMNLETPGGLRRVYISPQRSERPKGSR